MKKIVSVFLAANPAVTSQLRLDEEIRSITEKIRVSEHRELIDLISMWATRPDDLLQALNQHHPHIVHFSGHGSPTGEIILVDNAGNPKPVTAQAMRALFTTLKDNIHVVILNACYSKIQAQAIAEVIDCVIGMNTAIGDRAATIFAASFYRAIGFGRSVKEAFDQGVTALLLEGIPEQNTPELLLNPKTDPGQLVLLEEVANPFSSAKSTTLLLKLKAVANNDLGYGIKIGGVYQYLPLMLVASEWAKYADRGWIKSGWLYEPNISGTSHAVTFFKVHLDNDGTGYIHILDAANPSHTICLETQTGFRREQEFGWDNIAPVERTAFWEFRWK